MLSRWRVSGLTSGEAFVAGQMLGDLGTAVILVEPMGVVATVARGNANPEYAPSGAYPARGKDERTPSLLRIRRTRMPSASWQNRAGKAMAAPGT